MDKELKLQLTAITNETRQEFTLNLSKINEKGKDLTVDHIAEESIKRIEEMMKTKHNDSEEDCYYVLVIDDPKDSDREKKDVKTTRKAARNQTKSVQDVSSFGKSMKSLLIANPGDLPNVPTPVLNKDNDYQEDDVKTEIISDDTVDETQDSAEFENHNQQVVKIRKEKIMKNISSSKNITKRLTKSGAESTVRYLHSVDDENYTSEEEFIFYGDHKTSQSQILKRVGSEPAKDDAIENQIRCKRVSNRQKGSCLSVDKFDDTEVYKKRKSKHDTVEGNYGHNKKPRCTLCLKAFLNQYSLKCHMLTHAGNREFQCEICLKSFHQKIAMLKHRLSHITYPFSCNQCDKKFENKADLAEHKESAHCSKSKVTKVKEEVIKTVRREVTTDTGKLLGYACSLCKRMFSVESALEQHIERTHMVKANDVKNTKKRVRGKYLKRFECGICGKTSSSKEMFTMHKKVHANQRPYPCQICGSRFKTKSHVKTHQLTHTMEKKFVCAVCERSFAMKGNLVVHLRTHPGEWPFICQICGDAFIDSKYFKKHKLKKHSTDNDPMV